MEGCGVGYGGVEVCEVGYGGMHVVHMYTCLCICIWMNGSSELSVSSSGLPAIKKEEGQTQSKKHRSDAAI